MNPHSFDTTDAKPHKRGFGCLAKTLVGIIAIIIAIVGGAWLLIMHTSLPLRFVASVIEEGGASSNLKLTGTTGSLSSGLSFKKIEWDDGEITDLRFRYSGLMDVIRRDQLIIYEMHVGSATIDTSFFNDASEESDSEKSTVDPASASESADDSSLEIESTDAPSPAPKSSEPPLRLVRIDRVSLNKITIKNATTGNTISIPEIEWTGFKYENGAPLELGDLKADSDHLVVKTTTPKASEYQKRVEITLLQKLDARILKPIHIEGLIGEFDDEPRFDIMALDGTVTLATTADGTQQLRATGANLAEFLDAPLPNNLHLNADLDDPTLTVRSGSFLLGTKSFEIQSTTATEVGDKPEGTVFLALHRDGDTEIHYEIPVTESKTKQQSFTPLLTATPAMSPENLMALLFHDQEFSALAAADQEKLRQHMTWFTFTE